MTTPDDVYTHGHHESVVRSHSWRTPQNSAGYLLASLRPGQVLLDIGCGPGTITVGFEALVAPGRVIGVDRAPDIVAQAAAERPTGSRVEFRVADAYALDLPDDGVDVVHAHQVLQHLSDPVAALREWRRVCRPGGLVAARDADYAAFTWYPHDPLLDRWLELYRSAARANRAEPDAGRRLLAWAHEAGYAQVTATASVWCYADPAGRAFWGGMWAERIVSSALTDQLLTEGIEPAELDAISDAWLRWADHPDGWFMVPHGEIIATA